MAKNTWRDRINVLIALFILQVAHQFIFGDLPNTLEGMLVYYGTAALADFYLIYVAAELLNGELGFQIQCLSLASMVTNAVGYFAYEQYLSHWFYDLTMWGISLVLIYKLIWINRHAHDDFGWRAIWSDDIGGNKLYS